MWGSAYKFKLGNSSDEDQPLPIHVDFFTENNIVVKKLVCGGIHSQVLATDDNIYSFGCGSDGRLGHPECEGHRYLYKEKEPRVIEGLQGKVVQVQSGYYHVVALSK
jgi:regulator of chromosome condensation